MSICSAKVFAMPNLQQAKKALKVSAKKRTFNDKKRNTMKAALKEVRDLVGEGDMEKAKEKLPQAYKAIDKATKNGIIKKNNASRKKSRLTKLVEKKI